MFSVCKKVFLPGFSLLLALGVNAQHKQSVSVWLTDPGKSVYFQQQPERYFTDKRDTAGEFYILINEAKQYQTIDGFGFSLTGGSAQHLMKMNKESRHVLLTELFGTEKNNIGTSYLRISIGASDLSDHVFSYDDLPEGQTDTGLIHFDLGPDKKDVIPILKEILAVNPEIKIMGSPWSPPVWMKNNKDFRGGNLLPEYYPVYARYFVKYILEMRKNGIRIDAVTVQNEPLHPGNNPSLQMPAPAQGDFVKNHLGPAFKRAKIDTKIIIYDHNADRPDYPISILNDPEAKKYIDGSAFHLYGGKIETLSEVHAVHPDRNLYFTEQWIGAPGSFAGDISWHVENLVIGATRNWCRTVLEWNLASDPEYKPHTDRGGCTSCLGAITIDKNKVIRNPAYYIIAHASKWVRPGSVRIESNLPAGLPNAAFRTPGGKIVLIVLNRADSARSFYIQYKKITAGMVLAAGAVATYIW